MPDFCIEEAGYGMDTRCTKGNQNLPYVYNVWLDHGRQRSPKITIYVSTQDSSVVKVISAYFRILHCRHVKHKVSYRNTQYHVSGISNTSLTRVSLLTKHTLNHKHQLPNKETRTTYGDNYPLGERQLGVDEYDVYDQCTETVEERQDTHGHKKLSKSSEVLILESP